MNIIMLYQNDSIERLVMEVLGWEGYAATSTEDPVEMLRMIEESAVPCVVLTDNLKVNPAARDALATLRDTDAASVGQGHRPGHRNYVPDGVWLGHPG